MKTIFIPAKSKLQLDKSEILSIQKELPKNIALAYSVQYEKQAKQIKYFLEKNHKITFFSQVLGCSKPNFPKNTNVILLITDGKFHAFSLATESKLPVYVFENSSLKKISKEETEKFEKKQKASYLKFLNAEKIGILISTKPGQENLKRALYLKKKLKSKKSYLFISNNIDAKEFENFSIDSWLNTACPRLDMDSNIINMNKLKENKIVKRFEYVD